MSALELGKVVLKNSSEDGSFAEFVIDPLERGYGTTLGNGLRRVLLSSIPGSAASSVKIDGVTHEFSTISGIREDVAEIVLNIKSIIVKLNECDSKTVYLDLKGPCEFTASMIPVDSDFEILSNNLIATLDDNASLKMEITFTSGLGYVSADQHRAVMPAIMNLIPVDSLYSPVVKVNYFVENTRVGQVTDYDKLTFQVWTNGVVSAKDAVSYASNNLIEHFSLFRFNDSNIKFSSALNDDAGGNIPTASGDVLLDDLGLSARAYNSLKRTGINCLSDLMKLSIDDISGIRNLGKKSCDEIVAKLKGFGWKSFAPRDKFSRNSDLSEFIDDAIYEDEDV